MNNNIKYLNPLSKPMTAAGVGCTRLELWLVDLPKPSDDTHVQYGDRPAIVISSDAAKENSPAVTVIPLTSNRKKGQLPTHVFISHPGLSCSSIALCEQIHTLDKSRMLKKLGQITNPFTIKAVEYGLAVQLGLVSLLCPAA